MADKLSINTRKRKKNKEKLFEMPLSTLVSGVDASGEEFQEQTTLVAISSQKAVFYLNTKVTLWSKLNLSIEIPQTITLEKCLKLIISGTVTAIKSENKKQLISIKLNRKYKIISLRK